MKYKCRVMGTFDMASGVQVATVIVDRDAGLISVRVLKKKRVYTLPLASVASMICGVIIRAELREKKAAKKAARKARARR